MDILSIVQHLLNFLAPAVAVALALGMAERLFGRRDAVLRSWWARQLVLILTGLLALAASLWLTGVDGKVVGYAGLVVAAASMQWLLLGAWRK